MSHLSKALHHLNSLVGAEVFTSPVTDAALYSNRECQDILDFIENSLHASATGEHASPSQKRDIAT
jgi:hypothetical protein